MFPKQQTTFKLREVQNDPRDSPRNFHSIYPFAFIQFTFHFVLKRNHSTIELASKDGSLGLDFGAVHEKCSGPKSQLIIYYNYHYYYYHYCWNWQENGRHSRWLSELACYVITSSYHNIRHAFLYEACFLLPDEFTTSASNGILSERLFAVSQGFLSCNSCCRREARFAIFDLRRLKHVVDRTWVVITIVIPPRFSRFGWNLDGFDRFPASIYVWQRFDVAGVETAVSLFDAWARWFHSSSCRGGARWKLFKERGTRSQPLKENNVWTRF